MNMSNTDSNTGTIVKKKEIKPLPFTDPINTVPPSDLMLGMPGQIPSPLQSYAGGTPRVQGNQIARLEDGEAVIPAAYNPNNQYAEDIRGGINRAAGAAKTLGIIPVETPNDEYSARDRDRELAARRDMENQARAALVPYGERGGTVLAPISLPVDRVNVGPYGSRPGEQRLDTTYPVGPQAPIPEGLRRGDQNLAGQVYSVAKKAYDWGLPPIKSYQEGTPYIDKDQVAKLHRGEAVVPANENPNNQAVAPEPAHLGGTIVPDTGMRQLPIKTETPATPPVPDRAKILAKEHAEIQDRKVEALQKGDLVGLGTALLQEREMNRLAPMRAVMEKAAEPTPLKSYDEGTPYVDEDQIAKLHKGEEVIPADKNPNVIPSGDFNQGKPVPAAENKTGIQEIPEGTARMRPIAATLVPLVSPIPPGTPEQSAVSAPALPPVTAAMPTYTGPLAAGEKAPAPGASIEKYMPGIEKTTSDPEKMKAWALHDTLLRNEAELKQKIADLNMAGDREGMLKAKQQLYELRAENPLGSAANKPGVWGKIEHGLAMAGNIAGNLFAGPEMALIPGTDLNKQRTANITAAQLKEEEARKLTAAETAKVNLEAKTIALPKMLTGDDAIRTNTQTGVRERAWQMPFGGPVQWTPEGQTPATMGVQQGSVPAQGVAPGQFTYGGKTTPETAAASFEKIKNTNDTINSLPGLSDDLKKEFVIPEGTNLTEADAKARIDSAEKISAAIKAKDDKAIEKETRAAMLEIARQGAEEKAETFAEKQKKLHNDDDSAATQSYATLYRQQAYSDAMKTWQSSPSYRKDVAFVQEQADKTKSRISGALAGDAGLGALVGGAPGAAIGAGLGIATSILGDTLVAATDALKKGFISKAGYDALQAYYNTLPGRMSYEITVQKTPATVLRSAMLLQKIMDTVPPPNTPAKDWDSAFDMYYRPMDYATKQRNKGLNTSADYKPPTKEDIVGPTGTAQSPQHTIQIGDKRYTYKGAGDTADLKNYTEISPKK